MYNKFKKLEDQEDQEELVKKQKKETKDKKKKKKPSKEEKSDDEEENLDDYQPKSSVNKRKREKRQKRRAEMNLSSDSEDDDSKGKAPKKKEPVPNIIVVGEPEPSKDIKIEDTKDKDSKKKNSEKDTKKDTNEDIEDEEEKDSVISINDLDDFDVDDSRKKSKKRKGDDDVNDDGKKKKKKSRRSKLAEKLGFKKEEEPDRPLTFGEKVDKFFTLSGETRFIGFGILFGFGLIGILASFIFLEEIIDEPAPFCILYCIGFLFLIASTFFLLGPCRQIKHLMKPCRFICAAVFLITLILTLVMAIAVEEPTLTIVSLVIQFVAFGLYLISLCPCIQKCCSGMCSLLV